VSSSDPSERLVVFDDGTASLLPGRCVASWSLREPGEGIVSVPALVDARAFELREQYVTWAHDLGATLIGGRTIRAHLAFWPDFSFWWMGLIPEKEPGRTTAIYSLFKLRVLEQVYTERGCRGILYIGRDHALARTLRGWCRRLGHRYEQIWAGTPRRATRHALIDGLPAVVQGLGYLLWKCWTRYRLTAGAASRMKACQPNQATIVTFFPNIDLHRTQTGRFWSRYWERLHDVVDQLPISMNWVWLYIDSDQASFRETVRLRDVCNRMQAEKHRYFILDDFVTLRSVVCALLTYFRSCLASVRLRQARRAFHFKDSALNFFPIAARDWRASLRGVAAMDGALTIELFDEAARHLGPCVWSLFVWENQPWEHAAVIAWRRHGNGRIFGAQHATLAPLDLRAFIDPRELVAPVAERLPVPDVIAVNGRGARDLMRQAGFPDERLVVTEALRYLHLGRLRHREPHIGPTLLVITGFRRSETRHQLQMIEAAGRLGSLSRYRRIIVKPHPICMVEPIVADLAATFPHEVAKGPLESLWEQADVVFAANSTSAITEALCLGLPGAVCVPDDEMNMSTAFGVAGVPMVATVEELSSFLRAPSSAEWPSDYFMIDDSLSRWRALLDTHV
jgi:surface carbohydrate biosynthesis protein (TIGR04326 family)